MFSERARSSDKRGIISLHNRCFELEFEFLTGLRLNFIIILRLSRGFGGQNGQPQNY